MRISDRSSDVCSSDLAARWRTVRESRKPSRLSDPDRPQPLGRSDAPPDAGSCRILPSPSRARWRGLPRSDFADRGRSEEHTSELQSLMRNTYAVFCLKKKKTLKDRNASIYNIHNAV